jgi:hypothetical protein
MSLSIKASDLNYNKYLSNYVDDYYFNSDETIYIDNDLNIDIKNYFNKYKNSINLKINNIDLEINDKKSTKSNIEVNYFYLFFKYLYNLIFNC